jgi:signal transduction histidine kinase
MSQLVVRPRTDAQVGVRLAKQLLFAGLHARERADESEAARRRLSFLLMASQQLAASLEPATTMQALADLMVPEFGDGSVLRVLESTQGRPETVTANSEALAAYPVEWWEWLDRVTRTEVKRALRVGLSQVGSTFQDARPPDVCSRADVSYMIVPVRARARALGTLSVFSLAGRQCYRREELAVVEALGAQAGLALENARLYEEQRTIVERLELVRGKLDAVREEWLRDDERRRIARDLHDHVEQTFFLIGLAADNALKHRVGHGSAIVFSDALARTAELASSGAEQLRTAIFALNNPESAGVGLIPTLFKLVRNFHLRTGIEADLALTGRRQQLPTDVADALHATAREALANVERHARAGAAVLRLNIGQHAITLTVHDDGAGASSLVLKQIADSATHFGLRSLRDRVQRLNGTFVAGPGPDGGFLVRARIPLQVRSPG